MSWLFQRLQKFPPEIFTLDESGVQIERARKNTQHIPVCHMVKGDIRRTPFANNKFDTVVIKMGIHELPKKEQGKIFAEIYRILKPGGKFVIWELALSKTTQEFFQAVIRKKDELAGFGLLVKNRYFPRHDELVKLFKGVAFKKIKNYYKFNYEPSTSGRKD